MLQQQFAKETCTILADDPEVLGVAAGGSWITGEIDEFSDLDLVIVTRERISGSKEKMTGLAGKLGDLLNAFTGEHVGEPRVLICLYDNPLLHVDLKFVTIKEFETRVEDPAILLDKEGQLENVINTTSPDYPQPDFQWIEDRFWTWVHYASLKIGRGEYFEALDFLSYVRTFVIAPMMQVKNGQLPRGLRKVEFHFPENDLAQLRGTIGTDQPQVLISALESIIDLYQKLRTPIFADRVILRSEVEQKVLIYLEEIKRRV